jgi:hypothetical protein
MEAKSKAIELRDKHAKFQTYTVGFEVDIQFVNNNYH